MSNVHKVNFQPIVSRSCVDETIGVALHTFVGRGRPYSVKQLSNVSGVKDRCIEAAMAPVDSVEHRALNRENLFSITKVLGADFANRIWPLAGIGAFNLPQQELPHPGEVAAESAEDHAEIARAAADGKFCAADHRKLWAVGQGFIQRGMQLVGLGKERAKAA